MAAALRDHVLGRVVDDIKHIGMDLMRRQAPEQGGVISGINPLAFSKTDPIRLWVIQVVIIICTARLLFFPLRLIRQPTVISEVIGGIILGPTVMGRIPGFSNTIFPPDSLPYLSLTATIGLVMFLFLTALEVDVQIVKRNAKSSLLVAVAGIVLPFGLGAAIAVPIYHRFTDTENVNFGYFLLFVGVAMSITAFPVLCRILTELKLLDTNVGVLTLASGVTNDVIGWVLLALTVALVNASGGLVALYVLLSSIAWTLFLLFPVKWAYRYLARRTGSLESGHPTPFMMTVTLFIVFISAFMTDILGVHAIFGGFIAGLIIPHEGGYAIALVEKMEDFVVILLIPIYFTLSGLKTNLGLLDDGVAWGYVVLLCVVAFVGKFIGCFAMAKWSKFSSAESSAIGILMSCKGLVELIVLNIGLQAEILDQRTFSMFVVMAVVLTFITTPLVEIFYPASKRIHEGAGHFRSPGEKSKDEEDQPTEEKVVPDDDDFKSRIAVVLNKIEHVPAIMNITQLLQPTASTDSLSTLVGSQEGTSTKAPTPVRKPSISLDALRLIELTDRTSAVMQSSEADELFHRDALLSVVRTFGHLNRMNVSTALSVVNFDSFPSSVADLAKEKKSDLVIIPWNAFGGHALVDHATTSHGLLTPAATTHVHNPFESIFGKATAERGAIVYSQFVRGVFATSPTDVALFADRGATSAGSGNFIILPFFGGPDDRLALRFVVQLCAQTTSTALVLRVKKSEEEGLTPTHTNETDLKALAPPTGAAALQTVTNYPDTMYGPQTTEHRLESQHADDLIWAKYAKKTAGELPSAVVDALTRINFEDVQSTKPLHHLAQVALDSQAQLSSEKSAKKSMLLVVGRARRMAVENHHQELRAIISEHASAGTVSGDLSRTVGDVAAALVASGATKDASLLVMQAADSDSA